MTTTGTIRSFARRVRALLLARSPAPAPLLAKLMADSAELGRLRRNAHREMSEAMRLLATIGGTCSAPCMNCASHARQTASYVAGVAHAAAQFGRGTPLETEALVLGKWGDAAMAFSLGMVAHASQALLSLAFNGIDPSARHGGDKKTVN